ncbi:MAG: hypothetical protein ACYTGC_15010, partial [Planctomycetota bacterium]
MSDAPPTLPEDTTESRRFRRVRRTVINLIGFGIGAALFAWIVMTAVEGGDWSRLREASPWLIAALMGCTVVSSAVNGATFW